MRTNSLVAIVAICIGMSGFATAAVQPGRASPFIRGLGDQEIAALRKPDAGPEVRAAQFCRLLSERFDLPFIGRFVLGRCWNQATPEQRSDYLAVFGDYVLKTYSARLGGYAGEIMVVLSERPAGARDVVVSTRIERPSGAPFVAEWRVPTGGEERHRVIDVIVAGVSMVVIQRSEFAAVIRRHSLQGLIEVLRASYAPADIDPGMGRPRLVHRANQVQPAEKGATN
jgi:phospholipid transport system substrate-binding protein